VVKDIPKKYYQIKNFDTPFLWLSYINEFPNEIGLYGKKLTSIIITLIISNCAVYSLRF
jgi:hypothetical protein